MRIGILQADSVGADLAARHGDYPDMFRALLSAPQGLPAYGPAPSFASFDVRTGELPGPADCDAYVVTGSRHSVYDDLPWIPRLAEFVDAALERRRRVVGICFGHQLIAHYFGGRTAPAPGGWCVGVHRAAVVDRPAWMQPPAEGFKLLVSHRDQVCALPPQARTLAVAEQCPTAAFVLGDALAFQGHPEFTAGYADDLMRLRRTLLGEAVYGAGQASLGDATDAALVARWMLRFMSATT